MFAPEIDYDMELCRFDCRKTHVISVGTTFKKKCVFFILCQVSSKADKETRRDVLCAEHNVKSGSFFEGSLQMSLPSHLHVVL